MKIIQQCDKVVSSYTVTKQKFVMKKEKRLKKFEQNPNEVSFEDLVALLRSYGFEMRRHKGSHATFSHSLIEEIFTVPANRNPLLRIYVKKAIEHVNKVIVIDLEKKQHG